ncbi:MAG: oxidoreductase [Deltaproteobacteria bacterium]|nr:oxidoreductase [Deltaproteobacteria bacterium]
MGKPKVAFYWCSSCGGCEEAVIDLAEDVLKVVEAVDIVFWPAALDFKYEHVRALGDGELAVTFLNGAVRTAEQEELARLLRRKSALLVAYGACAYMGGIPALANLTSRAAILETAYRKGPTVVNPRGTVPLETCTDDGRTLRLPRFDETVRSLDQVVPVDYVVPGCAPPPDLTLQAVLAVVQGTLPPRGSVLAPDKALCGTCPRKDSKPDDLRLDAIRRIHEVIVEPDRCFLAAGVLCLGPGTRAGCGERCIRGHMPCTGCFGPTSGVLDHGAKLLSAVAAMFGSNDPAEIDALAAAVPDPAGTFYRYGLSRSLLRGRI